MNAYDYGVKLFHKINATIHGHICMYENEAGMLAKAVYMAGDGDHLEIGSMWGGSAILAAMVKKRYKLQGRVICIEPFRDGDCSPGYPGGKPDEGIFESNMAAMGVETMVDLNKCYSSPFPYPDRHFASAFVDGEHAGDMPLVDWQNVSLVADVVIYHDLYPHEPSVMHTAQIIRAHPEWEEIEQVGSLAAWRRK